MPQLAFGLTVALLFQIYWLTAAIRYRNQALSKNAENGPILPVENTEQNRSLIGEKQTCLRFIPIEIGVKLFAVQ